MGARIGDLHLMVVEDDDFQRKTLADMVRALGVASVTGAANGRQALQLVREKGSKPFDIALCDLNMPEMDGMELLRHLGAERRNIAIIITSALDRKLLASVGKMTALYGIQFLGVIEKPVLLPRLKELLAKYDGSAKPQARSAGGHDFTLDEIMHGFQAGQFEPYFQLRIQPVDATH